MLGVGVPQAMVVMRLSPSEFIQLALSSQQNAAASLSASTRAELAALGAGCVVFVIDRSHQREDKGDGRATGPAFFGRGLEGLVGWQGAATSGGENGRKLLVFCSKSLRSLLQDRVRSR